VTSTDPGGVNGIGKNFGVIDVIRARGGPNASPAAAPAVHVAAPVAAAAPATTSSTEKNKTATGGSTAINLDLSATAVGASDEMDVLVTLTSPVGTARSPVDVCCVIDVSGSMGTEASLKNQEGKTETHGLSLLDVVKHAVKTVITVLGPQDRVAIVSFSTDAKLVYALQSMTPSNQKKAIDALEALHPDGMTNLWAGAKLGLDELLKSQSGRVASLLLLTDGVRGVRCCVRARLLLTSPSVPVQASPTRPSPPWAT
jgi:Mg-chelatase subunit ChlD